MLGGWEYCEWINKRIDLDRTDADRPILWSPCTGEGGALPNEVMCTVREGRMETEEVVQGFWLGGCVGHAVARGT